MPREVFADELEAFLERLDAVAAARVVANEAGEIERIYATTESGRDDAAIRRAITSALMSQYNLAVDGWRVQIAQLEPTAGEEFLPDCRLVRLEETITESMTRVVVELRYEREGVQKTITGSAQAPPGHAHRLRTVAQAAVDALRPLARRRGRLGLEAAAVMPVAETSAALAAVSLASEHATVVQVGTEVVTNSEAEAVVGAVLEAARKCGRPPARTGRPAPDRRRQFEGLRAHYERLVRAGGEPPTVPTPAPAEEDVVSDLTEIRPEREGGATTVMREEARPDAPAAAKAAPRLSLEDAFYRRLVATGIPVHIRCRDGYEIPNAVVREYGTYSLMLEVDGMAELVFKHGIITIRPTAPLPPEPGPVA